MEDAFEDLHAKPQPATSEEGRDGYLKSLVKGRLEKEGTIKYREKQESPTKAFFKKGG